MHPKKTLSTLVAAGLLVLCLAGAAPAQPLSIATLERHPPAALADNATVSTECAGKLISAWVQVLTMLRDLPDSLDQCGTITLLTDLTTISVAFQDYRLCLEETSDSPDEARIEQLNQRIERLNQVVVLLTFIGGVLGCDEDI